jgi:hypothetical protein
MSAATYLVFGDLHGRVLPAFRLAIAWAREHSQRVDGLLQVGDLGYWPDASRLDKATLRHAADDPLELGVQLVAEPSKLADDIFAEPEAADALWFTCGNHEDYEALATWEGAAGGRASHFVADAYGRLRCIRDGKVAVLPTGLRVAALWGIDDQAPNARRKTPQAARLKPRSATQLLGQPFDVLLAHEGPRDAIHAGSGSDDLGALVRLGQPSFLFFGHYSGTGRRVEGDFGCTEVYHLSGLELRGPGGTAEAGSVGVLRWQHRAATFAYLEPAWLRTVTRHNWKHR